jgi:hypothetical protein
MEPNKNAISTASTPACSGDRNLLLRVTAYLAWAAFVIVCLGMAVSRGLCSADDGMFADIARSLSTGTGYATTFADENGVTKPIRFDPLVGTGPTLILPCALLFWLFGANEIVPGVFAVLFSCILFTIILIRIDRKVASTTFLGGVALFCIVNLAVFAHHFEQWHAFLGEIPAAALLLLAHWIAAAERPSAKSFLSCGVLLGLSVLTKHLAVFAAPGVFLILAFRLRGEPRKLAAGLRWLAACLLGCLIPIGVFELFKIQQLGFTGFTANWEAFLAAAGKQGMDAGGQPFWTRVQERLSAVQDRFALNPAALLLFVIFTLRLTWSQWEKCWSRLFAGLAASTAVYSLYWLMFSIGWPRYLVIAIGLAAFALCVPALACSRWQDRALSCVCVLVLVAAGIPRIPYALSLADNGIFRPSTERQARADVVAVIHATEERGPVVLASRWWAECVDVKFNLPSNLNFRLGETVSDLPKGSLLLLNRRFSINDSAEKEARAGASTTILAAGSFELLQTD